MNWTEVVYDFLQSHGLQLSRLSCPLQSPKVCSNSCQLSLRCYRTISSSATLFSFCLQSFPASGSFQRSWLLKPGGQKIGASAATLPMNNQGWFLLRLTGLISLQSKGLSRVFSSTTESINSLVLNFLYGPILTSLHDYWKSYIFDYIELCQQSDVSAF